jgi:uncharacterized protein DUF4124
MHRSRHNRAAVLVLLAAAALPAICSAEIYSWVDPDGVVTYSNLPPPNGVRVTNVIHEEPLSAKAPAEAAHQAEVSALNDRIRLLEFQTARQQRELVESPGLLPQPLAPDCGPGGGYDCSSDWEPYYTTALLPYYYGSRFTRRGFYGHGGHRPPFSPGRGSHVSAASPGVGRPR